ncbi:MULTISPECIES: fimbrial protein [Burkholderia]|nr:MULTISPECIES: fimbrial protein [Burkholderia]KVG86447.1 hypothetical protein WS81_29125 [Burkholderia sp. MSMB2040]
MTSVHASDGTVTFTGTISAQTCQVDTSTKKLSITLPTVSEKALNKDGSTAGGQAFTIKLKGCATGQDAKVLASFEPGSDVDIATGYLKNSDSATDGGAENVQLQLRGADANVIKVGDPSSITPTTIEDDGSANLHYSANYIAVGGAAIAGNVASHVTWTLNYE